MFAVVASNAETTTQTNGLDVFDILTHYFLKLKKYYLIKKIF
jgi:hypothetical protein